MRIPMDDALRVSHFFTQFTAPHDAAVGSDFEMINSRFLSLIYVHWRVFVIVFKRRLINICVARLLPPPTTTTRGSLFLIRLWVRWHLKMNWRENFRRGRPFFCYAEHLPMSGVERASEQIIHFNFISSIEYLSIDCRGDDDNVFNSSHG